MKRLIVFLLGALAMLAAAYIAAHALYLGDIAYGICAWALMPITDAVISYNVTVRGVNNYLAWIPAPVTAAAGHYLAFFYMPSSAGSALVGAVLAVVGAAAGDVVKKDRAKRDGRQ